MTAKGVNGFLRQGYHQAADVTDWTLTSIPTGWSLHATVRSSNAFRVSQRPLTFEAPIQGGVWRFPVLELQIQGVVLNALLGPKEPQ